MVKKMLKSKSKRMSTKKRFKIEKKVREHNRKLRKMAKLEKSKKHGKSKKLIIVPGECPFKDKILAEVTMLKENMKQEKLMKRQQIIAEKKAKKERKMEEKKGNSSETGKNQLGGNSDSQQKKTGMGSMTFEDLLKKAQDRGYLFEKVEQVKKQGDASLKAFYKQFQQVVADSDVVIEVLDARDPLGTRSQEAEEAVRSHSDKKLLMVLNKCDLVPAENLQKWMAYLKNSENTVVIPFKANTQKQKDNLGSVGSFTNAQKITDTKKAVGTSDLLGLLGVWAKDQAGGITVGVVGMPNVGKSSLINSLKRSAACDVGGKPGVTRNLQIIHLNSKLRLIDSPGICFSKETGNESMSIEKILQRVPKTALMLQYNIPDFNDSEEFLVNIATKYGQLKKGGIPNTAAAEQKLIHDWHTGTIRFFTEPPEQESTTTASAIVTSLSKPFSLDDFVPNNEVEMSCSQDQEDSDEDEEEEMQMQVEEEPTKRVTRSAARKSVSFAVDNEATETLLAKRSSKRQSKPEQAISPEGQKKLGLVASKKTIMKKLRKSKKKSAKHASALSDLVESMTM